MSEARHYIAIDLGAESGRVVLATLAGGRMTLREAYRFANGPFQYNGALHWDFELLMANIGQGLRAALALEREIASIGVDTWGVDYGLLDRKGRLIEPPYHYRDGRTQGMMQAAFEVLPRERIHELTGIQFLPFNTLYQLIACRRERPELLARAARLLFMPNLIMQRLTGRACLEATIASTSQMLDMRTGEWSDELLEAFGLPRAILPELVAPGTCAGTLTGEWCGAMGCGPIPVVAVGTHDTASAVAGVPATEGSRWAYLSSGTWSLMGIETAAPVINDETCAWSFTNEGGVCGTVRLLKNIMGLWVLQECRRHWAGQGMKFEYSDLVELATEAEPFAAVLDVDDESFLAPGEMPRKITAWLERTGQRPIEQPGAVARLVLEGLALKYGEVMRRLERLGGGPIDVLHVVGGGIRNTLLNQLTADATGKMVVAGPIEATVAGNVLVQALAAGQIDSLAAGRRIIAESFGVERHEPRNHAAWTAYRERAEKLMGSVSHA